MPHTQLESSRFHHRLRVRWAEVDMQKIVFNAHYLMYLDTAMADYWRALVLPYEATLAALQGDLYVKKVALEYHASAHLDDLLDVALRCQHIGKSSMVFAGDIRCNARLLVSGELVYVFADPATQKSRPVPAALRDVLLGFEANEPMMRIEVGHWASLAEGAHAVRLEVFVQEQQIPLALEQDAADEGALHVLIRNRLGLPVATGRLLQAAPGVGQIGRLAVNRVLRGAGLGQMALKALLAAAGERGDRMVMLHAQASATDFYLKQGFVPRG
ncbi:YbgC/FadM family acyl-CoA thioesterase, partial [Rhodoferax sp.]|uniref:YbgC/FadM family acyl-CoA thioesterase n=1 Tax=Rhodoferax sp. TaxID=50421 RepID=UPI0019DA1303